MEDPRPPRPAPGPMSPPLPPRPTARPRKVYNGVKLRNKAGPDLSSWAAQRWMRIAEANAPADQLAEGIQYAKAGQTRTINVAAGNVTARVQGRMPDAYPVAIRLPTFNAEEWDGILAAMTAQARYAATLLAGALPANIEDIFAPLGLRLFPVEPSDLAVSCTCDISRGVLSHPPPGQPYNHEEAMKAAQSGEPQKIMGVTPGKPEPWCKHVCCVMALLADRFSIDPFLIFTLRGMNGTEVLERLGRLRAAASAGKSAQAATPIYLPHLPELTDAPTSSIEETFDRFYTAGSELNTLSLPIAPPEVSHPLLRRLGASPFAGAKFPLLGLLSTCYRVIGEAAVNGELDRNEAPENSDADGGGTPSSAV